MKRKINILFIIDIYAGNGGTERHLAYLASRLDKEKFNIDNMVEAHGSLYEEMVFRCGTSQRAVPGNIVTEKGTDKAASCA